MICTTPLSNNFLKNEIRLCSRHKSFQRCFAHEFTHFIEKHNSVEYENFRELVFEEMRRNGTAPEDLIDAYMSQNPNIDHDGASREVIAEAMTDILPQSSFVEQLARKQPGFFRELLGKLKDFVQRIKDYFANIGSSRAVEVAAVKREVDGVIKYADEIVEMFDRIAVQAVEHYQSGTTAQKKTAGKDGGQMQIRQIGNTEKFYVQADRQVLTGDDPKAWGKQIEKYINETIRKEQDVAIPTSDGHVLLLTSRSAYKLKDNHIASIQKKLEAVLPDNDYALKGRAATHIDELIRVARFNGYELDWNNKHENDIGEDGFNYFEAFFRDFDGKYYLVPFSAGLNAREETVYSIGKIRQRSFPADTGSSPKKGALKNGRKASKDIIYTSAPKSQEAKSAIQLAYERALSKKATSEQHQDRTGTLTNRDILEQAAQMEDNPSINRAQRNALGIYSKKLGELRQLERQRSEKQAELAQKEKAGAAKRSLVGLKNQIKVLDQRIARESDKLLEYEKVDHLKAVIEQVKPVIVEQRLTEWKEKYGTIRRGEKAVRDDSLPVSTDGKNKVSRTNPAEAGQENAPAPDEVGAETEVGAEGLSGVDTGPAKVRKITSFGKGKMTVKLEDGSEVSVKDADLDPEDGVALETIAKIGGISVDDANYILGALKAAPGVNSQWSALGATEAYKYGFYGMSQEHMTEHGVFANSLTESQRKAIYETGRNARQTQVDAKQETVSKKETVGDKTAPTGKVHFEGDRSALTERQSASLTAMEKIADIMGVQIHVFESEVGKNGKRIGSNGWYDPRDNSIHIDLHAGEKGADTMLFTLAHELTHHIRKWSPAKFKVLADFLMEEYGKQGVNVDALVRAQIDKARNSKTNSRKLTYDQAYEEVVADSMETMLADGKIVEKLAKLKARDHGLWQKIKDFISELAAKIRSVYEGLKPDSVEGRYVAEMKDSIERLQELFAEALVDASENYQMAEKNTTDDGGVEKYSFRGKNKDGIEVYETSEHVKSLSWKERKKLFLQLMRNQYRGRTAKFVRNGHAYYATFEYRDVSKNIYGDTASDPKGRDAKVNVGADGNIFELVEHSEYFMSEAERGKTQRMHRGVKYWDYFIKTVQIDGNVYDVLAHIRKKDSGNFVYDIEMYQNKKIEPSSPEDSLESGRNGMPNSSNPIIRNGNGDVKPESVEAVDAVDVEVDAKTEAEIAEEQVEQADRDLEAEVKLSDRDYSYETLVSKPDMVVTEVGGNVPKNRADVVAQAKKNAASVGRFDPKTGSISVHVDDINTDVFLGTDGLKHGLRRTKNAQNDANYIVTLKAGEIIKNSIKINEANPKKQNATGAYVMIGAARNASGDVYIVRSVVNQFKNELAAMDVLYAINAKKELAALDAPRSTAEPLSVTSSTISIAELLDHVNQYFPDILPEEVLKHYGYDARPEGDFGENVLYSDRDTESVSNRSLLANAFESVAQTYWEKQKLTEYKGKIELIEAEERKLQELRGQIKELSFAKGPRDKAKISALRDEATKTANRISIYDQQLLRLEGSKPLQAVLEREKKKAYQRAEQKGKEALAETQRKAIYETGRNARQTQVDAKQASVSKKETVGDKTAPTGKVHFEGDRSALTERQSASLDAMEKIADIMGVQIYVFESYRNKHGRRVYKDKDGVEKFAPNGWYEPGDSSIHIDLHAGQNGEGTMLFTLAHELTHHIRKWSPAKFKILADFLMEEYGKTGASIDGMIREQINKAKRSGRTISYDTAYEEFVADSMEAMLSDGNVMKRLEKLKARDQGLWQEIKSFIDKLAAKIRKIYKNLTPDSTESLYVADMGKAVYRLQELFAEALVDASENFQSAEVQKNTTQQGGTDVLYKVRDDFASELRDWFEKTTHEQRAVSGKRFLVGTTSETLKSIKVKDYNIYMGGSKIDKILEGNTSMTVDTIADAVLLLDDPILVMKSLTVENSIVLFGEVYTTGNKPVMISLLLSPKTKSGEILDYAVITSAYGRNKNNLQNMINRATIYYVNEQKDRTDAWLKALGLQLPSALTKYGPINTIEYSDPVVKPESVEAVDVEVDAKTEAEIAEEQVEHADRDLEAEVKYSLRDVKVPTRTELEEKDPIKVVDISTAKTKGTFAERRRQILKNAEKIISKPYLNRDTKTWIFLTEKSYTHAFNNTGTIQLNAAEHLPELIENAVLTHAENPTHGSEYTDGVYTFFAAARAKQIMPVKLKVKEYNYVGQLLPKNIRDYFDSNPGDYAASYDTVVLEVEEIEKSPSGSVRDTMEHDVAPDPEELSTIKVADLLGLVNGEYEKYIPKFSDRDTESVSNRSLLANAFESVAQTYWEKQKLQEYKGKIDLIEAEERKLQELRGQIKELSFAKGPRDKAKLTALRDEATKTANRISIYDTQLLRLEASKPLQAVLEREKKKAYQRAEQKGKESLTETQRKAIYETGRNARQTQVDAKQEAVSQKGSVAQKASGKVHFEGDRSGLTERRSASLDAMEKIENKTAQESQKDGSKKVSAGKKTVRKRGRVKGYGVTSRELNRAFNSTQKQAYAILDRIAAVTGIDIVLFQSKPDANGELRGGIVEGIDMNDSHGAFSWHNNKIYIDINAGVLKVSEMGDVARYSMLRTFTHEFTHFIEKHNPEQYETFRELVFDVMRRNGENPDVLIDEYMDKHKGVSRDDASREVVAEAMTDILPETSFIQELAQKHRGIHQKLMEKLKEFVADIKAHFKSIGATVSKETAAVKEHIDGMVRYADELVEMFDRIAVQAVENYQAAEMAQKNTATKGGVQYRLKEYSEQQRENWRSSKRILVYNNAEQLTRFIQDSIANKTMDKKMYFGAIPGDLARKIQTDTGLNVENYNLSLGSYEVRKILKDHGNENKEAPRGQRAIVVDDFAHIVDIILNPTKIELSADDYMGKPAIVFTGNHNGRMNVVAVVSDKRLDLFVQTVFVNVKKGNLATPIGDQAPINTPEANNGTVSSKDSIRDDKEKVNIKSSKVQHQAKPSAKNPMVLDPKTVTKADVAEMLENVKSHKYADNTYIPVRISTPGIVQERLFAEDLPIIMPVSKVAQAFSRDNGPTKGKNVRGHSLSIDQLIDIVERMDSPDFVYSQDNGRGVEVIRLGDASDNTVVIVEFDNNVNPAYMNGYEGGTYNVSVTTFNVDGGNVGLFMYGQEKGWHEVFNKQKEGDPAKKFPATRPFAVEQGSLNDNVPQRRLAVNNNSSSEQHQDRTGTLTNRDILEQAAQMEDNPSINRAQRNALGIYSKKLGELRQLERQRSEKQAELAQKEKAGAAKRSLVGLKNQIKVLDQRIARESDKLLEYEKVDHLKTHLVSVTAVGYKPESAFATPGCCGF